MPSKTFQRLNMQEFLIFLIKNAHLRVFIVSLRTKVLCYFHFSRISSDGGGVSTVTIHQN